MSMDEDDQEDMRAALDALQCELAALGARLGAVESSIASSPRAHKRDASGDGAVRPAADELTPELLAVISAVLAAHLGVKPHIRQITLLSGASWAQQGRVTIQASHALAVPRD
jgi:methylmalonyl-CoA carboxyltransferase large subunit